MSTKKDIVDRIAEKTASTHVLAKIVVQQFLEEVTQELAQGNRIELRDFGVFASKTTPARMAQNPRTLTKVQVPARSRVAFKMGRRLKNRMNGGR